MEKNRLFSRTDLDDLGTPLSVRLREAASKHDAGVVPEICRMMNRECIATYGDKWSAVLQTFLVEHGGEAAHDAAAWFAADLTFREYIRAYASLTFQQHLEEIVGRLRSSGSTFRIEQDNTKVRFVIDSWGPDRLSRTIPSWQESASSLLREGHRYFYPCGDAYGPDGGLALLAGRRPLTGDRDVLPCLLAPELLFYEALALEELGSPIAVVGVPEVVDGPATLDVHRRAEDVPDAVFERLGAGRPRSMPASTWSDADTWFPSEQLVRWETPLSIQVEEAATRGDWDHVIAVADRLDAELVCSKDPMSLFRTAMLTWIAREWGEGMVEAAFDRGAPFVMRGWFSVLDGLSVRETIETWALIFRAHGSTFEASEDDDVVVFRGVLGACGRMLRTAGATKPYTEGRRVVYPAFGAYEEPMGLHVLTNPAPMTHMASMHPIYSAHCHVFHEQFPREVLGHPLFLEFHPRVPEGEVVHVHAKVPGRFPTKYLDAVDATGVCLPARNVWAPASSGAGAM